MTKGKLIVSLTLLICGIYWQNVIAQIEPQTIPTPKLSITLLKNLEKSETISRERREKAYVNLLEAQRYLWGISYRLRSPTAVATSVKLAKEALLKAIESDPTLSEAYTLLAEIVYNSPPNDIEEAISLANIAIRLNPNSYGAHQLSARLYTIRSRVGVGILDPDFTAKAISAWKEMTRLDPIGAEAWAFLSNYYYLTGKNDENIEALKKWMSATVPSDQGFYRRVFGKQEDLSPESAGVRLGAALLKAGRLGEAIETLSRAVANDPENEEAIDLLRQAIQSNGKESSNKTLEFLQQAVYANPGSLTLIDLLAEVQARLGKTDDAVKTIKTTITNFSQGDKNTSARLYVSLGDIYSQANRTSDAIAAYENALKVTGIEKSQAANDDDRDFVTKVFEKIINVYKNSGRINDAKAAIERARTLLGKDDLFADKQIISLLRETRHNQDALITVRLARKRVGDEYSLLRLEASILTDLGKVDEGVALIKTLIDQKLNVPTPFYDNFSNYIFISGLYTQAKRTKESIASAQKAYAAAESDEQKQIANLSLANAQHQSGDFKSAEEILLSILKKTPGNPIALNNLGYFWIERNIKITEAVGLIKQAVTIDPTNSSYLDSLGWGYFKLGNLVEAEKYLKEALQLNPTSPTIFEHLGDVYQKQGRSALAKNAWQKALSLSSDSAIATRIKGKITDSQ